MSSQFFRIGSITSLVVLFLLLTGCGKKVEENVPQPLPKAQVLVEASVKEIETVEEFTRLMESGKGIIVKFHATWCPPCKRMKPIFDAVAKKYNGQAHFVSINIDVPEVKDLVDQFIKEGVPTFVFIDKCGQTVDIHPGGYDEKEFNKIIEEFVKKQC